MHRIRDNNSVHEIGMHFVFCTKYRKKIFTGFVEVELKHILAQTCAEYDWKLEALEIQPEHVHIFLQINPTDTPCNIIKTLKSISALYIFTKFPDLKGRKFWGNGLWSPGTFYSSANVDQETIKNYIENQKEHHGN